MSYETAVIKIISDTKILIRGGWNDGINKGDKFNIVVRGEDVIDPETEKNLGSYDFIKANLTVIEVFEKFSVLSNLVNKKVPVGISAMVSAMSIVGQEKTVTEAVKIPVVDEEITPIHWEKRDSYVHIGDVAVKIDV